MPGITSRLRIDLDALAANYRLLREHAAPAGCAAVVKADAYGLGLREVVGRLQREGCRAYFVATAAEGAAVRALDQDTDVYVFSGPQSDDLDLFAAHDLIPVLNDAAQRARWQPLSARPVCVHVDTGMNRLGYPPHVTAAELDGLDVKLLMTHLACADAPEHVMNAQQIDAFEAVAGRFPGVKTSIGNSAGTLLGPPFQGDLCRPGIALYGGNPFIARPNPMRPVVRFEGRVLQVRRVAAGDRIGYGATYTFDRARTVAVVGAGYGDGLPRLLSSRGEAAIGARRVPMVGRVSMDLCALDVTGLEHEVGPGDWVQLFGDVIGVDEVATAVHTISYEVLSQLTARPPRTYFDGSIGSRV